MRDVKPKYLSMGRWNKKIISKKARGSRTKSSVARSYVAVPPPEGWRGGLPEQNGLRGRAR
jgi:hypothetical protein